MQLGRFACQKTPLGMVSEFRWGGSNTIPKWHLGMVLDLKKGLKFHSKKKKNCYVAKKGSNTIPSVAN